MKNRLITRLTPNFPFCHGLLGPSAIWLATPNRSRSQYTAWSLMEAGADVLYAPGLHQREDIKAIVTALSLKPVNILVSRDTGLNVFRS